MPLVLRIALIVLSLVFLVIIVRLVIKKRLMLKYSMLWMLTALVVLIIAIFPEIAFFLADLIGIKTSSNLVIFVALGLLLLICLSQSIVISRQTVNERKNIQEIALLKKEIETLKKTKN